MTLLIGIIGPLVGGSGMISAIARGHIKDKSGWIYIRRSEILVLFLTMVLVLACMALVGVDLIAISVI